VALAQIQNDEIQRRATISQKIKEEINPVYFINVDLSKKPISPAQSSTKVETYQVGASDALNRRETKVSVTSESKPGQPVKPSGSSEAPQEDHKEVHFLEDGVIDEDASEDREIIKLREKVMVKAVRPSKIMAMPDHLASQKEETSPHEVLPSVPCQKCHELTARLKTSEDASQKTEKHIKVLSQSFVDLHQLILKLGGTFAAFGESVLAEARLKAVTCPHQTDIADRIDCVECNKSDKISLSKRLAASIESSLTQVQTAKVSTLIQKQSKNSQQLDLAAQEQLAVT
jgi:hypothetical protein